MTPISLGEGFPTIYIMIGAVAIAAVAIVPTFTRRLTRKRLPESSSQINPTLQEK